MRRKRMLAGPLGAVVPALIALSTLTASRACAQSSNAGPWIETRNGYYATARLGWANYSQFYDLAGSGQAFVPARTEKIRVVDLDTEYGISHRLTLHLAMPVEFLKLQYAAGAPPALSNSGFGDLLFGFKYGFLDPAGRTALALEVDANTPTGYNAFGFAFPPLGRGKFSVDGHLHGGLTLDPTPVYVQAEFGYRNYTDRAVFDVINYGAEAGVFATPRVLLVADFESAKAHGNTTLYYFNATSAQGLVQYRVKPKVNVMAGYARTLSGKQVTKGGQLVLGVALLGNGLGRYRGQAASGEEPVAAAAAPPRAAPPAPAPVPAAPAPTPAPADTSQAPAQPK